VEAAGGEGDWVEGVAGRGEGRGVKCELDAWWRCVEEVFVGLEREGRPGGWWDWRDGAVVC
jgi:hypothetical protein